MAKYMTTDTLIESVKRRATLPTTQITFTEKDFLAFANEEMDIGIVPHILQFHEDYLMQIDLLPVTANQSYYEIPGRSTGNKIRMVHYMDTSGNVFEMTRVLIEDLPYYQNGSFGISNTGVRAFYIENDEIVLLPVDRHSLTGFLQVSYYLRPNELVPTNTVSTITSFDKYTGIVNVDMIPPNLGSAIPMDILQTKGSHKRLLLDTTPSTVSTPSAQFIFGVAPITNITCSPKASIPPSSYFNLVANGNVSVNNFGQQTNDSPGPNTLSQNNIVWYDTTGSDLAPVGVGSPLIRVDISAAVSPFDVATATAAAINAASLQYFSAQVVGSLLQINTTLVGLFSQVGLQPNLLFTQVTINIPSSVMPDELSVGDYVAEAEQCIIPNIPTDLHSMLAQRIACRCLEALGDMQGLQMANQKLAEMELKTGSIIDNRVEGAPLKVVNRHGFLRQSRRMLRR